MSAPAAVSSGRSGSVAAAKKRSGSLHDLNGESNIIIYLRNLRLLDLDVLPDWPDISTATYLVQDVQQNQKKRIQSTEWALFRLFQIWDISTAVDKLQPFFPPLEPLQSLNLRAALFRCLSDLKKQGILGRDAVLRKSMLDECKGDRFEEVLAIFSTAVLKRRLSEHGELGIDKSIAFHLATADALPPNEQNLIPSLILSYRATLSRNLQERDRVRAQCEDLTDLLDLRNRQIRRREEDLLSSVSASTSVPETTIRDIAAIDQQIQSSWLGDPSWTKILQDGEDSGVDKLLQLSFDHAWKHVLNRTLFEIEEESIKWPLAHLSEKFKQQQYRLEHWKAFKATNGVRKPKAPPTPQTQKSKQPAIKQTLCFDRHVNMGLELQQAGPESSKKSESSADIQVTSSSLHEDYMRLMEKMDCELKQSSKPKRRKSATSARRYHGQSKRYAGKRKDLADTERVAVNTDQSRVNHIGDQKQLDSEAASAKPMQGNLPTKTGKCSNRLRNTVEELGNDPGFTLQNGPALVSTKASIKEQAPVSVPNEKNPSKHFSLAERTRKSMAGIEPNVDYWGEESVPTLPKIDSHLEQLDELAPANRRATLLERTRQSMSAAQLHHFKNQDKTTTETPLKKEFPINQFETPRKSIVPENKGGSSTPKEDLFNQEADYASVFKSRPKIKTSPHVSPELAKVEIVPLESENGEDSSYDWQVESSPLGRLGR